MTRVWDASVLEPWQWSAAEVEGRRQVQVFTDWLQREVPWFRHAFLETIGVQLGVRESRRIVGRHTMTASEVTSGARFADGITRSGYFIDIHNPTGSNDAQEQTGTFGQVRSEFVPHRYYEIPFRCLQPPALDNLLVACRAISTTFEAHAATRVMATMHGVGQAAGEAAALALAQRCQLADVDGASVRRAVGYLPDSEAESPARARAARGNEVEPG
jgi:hypothetical protein